jgi:hypothetical protein
VVAGELREGRFFVELVLNRAVGRGEFFDLKVITRLHFLDLVVVRAAGEIPERFV